MKVMSGAEHSRLLSPPVPKLVPTPSCSASSRALLIHDPQARDAYYKCVEEAGVTFTTETPPPSACKAARAEYEAACKASWVRHFDVLQDKRLRYLQTLRTNIAKQTQTGAGSQQGKAA